MVGAKGTLAYDVLDQRGRDDEDASPMSVSINSVVLCGHL